MTDTDQSFDDYLGPWWDETRVLTTLQVSVYELANMRKARQVIGIEFNDRRHYYPARQFTKTDPVQIIPGLQQVLDVLNTGIQDPETWATWLAGEYDEGVTVYDALLSGHLAEVIVQAKHDVYSWTS